MMLEKSYPNARELAAALILGLALAATYIGYMPGLSGPFHFDDTPNLAGLAHANDWINRLAFVFSGSSGPLQRPVALATFLIDQPAWPADPATFLRNNVLIHLLNGTLLAWCLMRLSLLQGMNRDRAAFIATAAGGLWMLMPLLASSSLLIVQRMTTISALFVFLGLCSHLWFRARLDTRPRLALWGMSGSLIVFTLLATLSKENGALLPCLVLVTELTLLHRRRSMDDSGATWGLWKWWQAVFLWLPALLIAGYLISRIGYSDSTVAMRGFNAGERLLTQARILWQYLFLAFLPQAEHMGPYHDGYPVSRSLFEPLTLLAVAGWLIVMATAIFWRRRFPLLAFAVGWYLVGHVLESTIIPLELYFEHRNYVPLAGPVYALVAALFAAPPHLKKYVYAGLPLYALALLASLASFTRVWGDPALSAELWFERNPGSARATSYLAIHQGQSQGPWAARMVIEHGIKHFPDRPEFLIEGLMYDCVLTPEEYDEALRDRLNQLLAEPRVLRGFLGSLNNLIRAVTTTNCQNLTPEQLVETLEIITANPAYQARPEMLQHVYRFKARLARHMGDTEQTISLLETALETYPEARAANLLAYEYVLADQPERARQLLRKQLNEPPPGWVQALIWRQRIAEYLAVLESMEDVE